MISTWFQFIIGAAILVIIGMKLTNYGDIISKKTGVSSLWVGVFLLAFATSLPEVVADVSAGAIGAIDLAVGDVYGSGMSNMLILAIIDIYYIYRFGKSSCLHDVSFSQSFAALLAIVLTGISVIFIVLRIEYKIFEVGIDTIILGIIYVLGIWALFREQQEGKVSDVDIEEDEDILIARKDLSLARAFTGFFICILGIFISAPLMVSAAEIIAIETGLGTTFMGTMFLAAVTSFPELVVSVTAIRVGLINMAIGNLFGSNAFNILVLLITDVAYRGGALLSDVSSTHIITGLILLGLMTIGRLGIVFQARKKYLLLIPDALFIIAGYGIGMIIIYTLSR